MSSDRVDHSTADSEVAPADKGSAATAPSRTTPSEQHHGLISWLGTFQWVKLATLVASLLASVYVIVTVTVQFRRKVIIIEAFTVPKSLEESGLTGKIVASHLLDAIHDVDRKSAIGFREAAIEQWREPEINAEIPGTKLSTNQTELLLRNLTRRDTRHFWGEVITEPKRLLVTIRTENEPAQTSEVQMPVTKEGLDAAIHDCARYYFYNVRPYIWAASQDPLQSGAFIQRTLKIGPDEDKPWALNLEGVRLSKYNADGAIAKYRQATDLNQHFAPAYGNWAFLLFLKGRYIASATLARRAASLDGTRSKFNCILAASLAKLGRFDESDTAFKLAIDHDFESSQSIAWWVRTLVETGRKHLAINVLESALATRTDRFIKLDLANLYVQCSRYEEGISMIEEILDGVPTYEGAPPPSSGEATALLAICEQFDAGIARRRSSGSPSAPIDRDPSNAVRDDSALSGRSNMARARILAALGRFEEAIPALSNVVHGAWQPPNDAAISARWHELGKSVADPSARKFYRAAEFASAGDLLPARQLLGPTKTRPQSRKKPLT